MVKARELVAVDQIKSAARMIEAAVKELGIEGFHVKRVHMRVAQEDRSYMEGSETEKGERLSDILRTSGFTVQRSVESENRPVREVAYEYGNLLIYNDIAINPLARLKAEQERIAAEIAALEGEEHGTA